MTNDKSTQPGREGLYRVNKERALHWTVRGITSTWATAGQAVDLTSQYLCEYVQRTGQMHKLSRVEHLAPGEKALVCYNAPQPIRNAYEKFHKSGKAVDIVGAGEDGLPSLVKTEPEAEPEAEAEAEAGDAGKPGKPDPVESISEEKVDQSTKTSTRKGGK